jgi:RHS repeat-associated protein
VLAYDDGSRITLSQKADATDSRSFDYDTLDRLTSYIAPGASQNFGYDANGNRASQMIGADTNTYNYAAGDNRLASVVSSAGSKLYSYDAAGNQTGVSGLQVHSYAYDARGRMISADNQAASYLVNGLGQRVQKTVASPASTTFFVYDEEGKLIGEYDASGAPVQELVYLNDLPVASLRGADIYYIWADQLNTPRQITNATNQLVWRWDSDPFGLTPADENPVGLGAFSFNLRFPGQYSDRETNLHYNYFRDYDPAIGRYVESDPIGLKAGLNTYAYVDGNPIRRIDPNGLWSTDAHNLFIYYFAANAFPDVSTSNLNAIYAGSAYADSPQFQTSAASYMHAMSSSAGNQEQAQQMMCNYVNAYMNAYRGLASTDPDNAYFYLGMALHPVMDSTSPSHRGFQSWPNNVLRHGDMPFSVEDARATPPYLNQTVDLMNQALSGDSSACSCK